MTQWCRLLCLTALAAVAAFGQATTSLRGTVTDPTGAVIPGAEVILLDPETQFSRSSLANESGIYQFPQVPPGTYTVLATADGFTGIEVADVVLAVGQPATLPLSFTEVGSVTESISVSAEASPINTTDASLGNTMGERAVLQLPFNARNVVNMLSLQPGVTFVGDTQDLREDRRAGTINGARSDQSNITLDGVDVNDQQNRFAFTAVLRSTLDSVQEFRVTTLNADPSQGRSGGAQVQLVTKSGTNQMHGSLYEFHRNTKTAANDFFNNSSGVDRQKLIRNVFGGSVGGPIKKNRAFFFLNSEIRRDASDGSAVRVVPMATMRQGIVRYERADGTVASLSPDDIRQTVDPLGIGPNPNSLNLFNSAYADPNDTTVGDGLNTAGFRFNYPIALSQETYIAKMDFNLDDSGKHRMFVRGQLQSDKRNEDPQFPGLDSNRTVLDNSKGIALGYDIVLTPNLFGSTRYGYTRQGEELTGVQNSERVMIRGLDEPLGTTQGITRILPVHMFRQDMSWIKGRHTVKFGAVYRNVQNRRTDRQNSFHEAEMNSSWLEGAGAEMDPSDLADSFSVSYRDAMTAVLGLVPEGNANFRYNVDGSVLAQGDPIFRNFANEELELYAMDTWQAARGLTLTYGLRWSLMPPVKEVNGVQTSPNIPLSEWLGARAFLADNGASQASAGVLEWDLAERTGRGLYPYHKKNIAPRFSLAYSPQNADGFLGKLFGGPGKTVFRAGAGMFYDIFGQGMMRRFSASALGFSSSITNPASSLNLTTVPRFSDINSIPNGLIGEAPPGGFPQVQPDLFQITNALDDSIVPPYSVALNFSVGRDFGRGFYLETSYVGRLSRRVLAQGDLAMPTDLRDPASGQTYFEAATLLAQAGRNGVPVQDVAAIPFWENMWPGAANNSLFGTSGVSATQAVYELMDAVAPDYTFGLLLLDDPSRCAPSCSRLGPWSMFNAQYSALAGWRNVFNGSYHAGQLTLRKRFSDGLQFDLNYTLSKAIDFASFAENSGNFDGFIVNTWSPGQMRAVADYDMRHQINLNYVWELPVGRGKPVGSNWNPVLNQILGGWQLSGLYRQTSGMPADILNGRNWPTNWNVTGNASQVRAIPTGTGSFKDAPALAGGDSGPNIFEDPQAGFDSFAASLPGSSGGRNAVRGDGFFTLDMAISKRFPMPWEGHSLQFRAEAFNLTNTTRFDPGLDNLDNEVSIVTSLTSGGSFGRYSATLTNPRVLQFALRYEF